MIKHLQSFLTILALCILICIGRYFFTNDFEDESDLVDKWLEQNDLGAYKKVFRDHGISTLSGCGTPEELDKLPEFEPSDEQRVRIAARRLQQSLIFREYLWTYDLQHVYTKLEDIECSSIEDVYWVDDKTARTLMEHRDFKVWSKARQNLPTTREGLQSLKSSFWNAVVKKSSHRDAWTWGGMLVVSLSMAGLVTLAAMTQPALVPEAKHSLLQYVTGKYLHPPYCTVKWGWVDPQVVGETMCFTVHFFQRNGNPYPICDTDQLCVTISHGTRKIITVCELGSGDPAEANTARIKFTVRASGTYVIGVVIDGGAIAGSPFRKTFVGGAVEARRSCVARHGVALMCRAAAPRALHLQPRDHYDNPAGLAPAADAALQGFAIRVSALGAAADAALSESATFEYDAVNQRVTMTICFAAPGIYRAVITYDRVVLLNGEFDCIVLTASEMTSVQRNISSKRHNISYEARLLTTSEGPAAALPAGASASAAPCKPRRVLCCISPKQLTIKEYIFKFIPKRITSFRLCPSTKLTFVAGDEGVFWVDDGVQAALQLASPNRQLVAATYTQLLLANMGGEDTFKNKQEFFYSELRAAHARLAHDKLPLRVARAELLASSLKATKHFTLADWCKNFEISFQGELGVDWGGLRREWFSLLCGQLFDSKFGLFVSFSDQPSGLVHPNPNRPSHLKLKHFELAGKLVGKCLYESALGGCYRQLVRARLTRSFLAQIIGLRVNYKYFEQDDPELYLSKIKYILETDLDSDSATEIYFAEDEYDSAGKLVNTHQLVPDGANIRVRNATKHVYLDALAQWRLAGRCRRELDAFLRGLALLVPDNLLAIFDETELELLVCGTAEVSVADWRAHALVSGGGEWARAVRWLWAALASFSAEERARLLQFTTGCSQLPPGGFQELMPRYHIMAAPSVNALPTAHTCFNQLCLPDYDSYEQLVHALLWAINEGAEGFAMI